MVDEKFIHCLMDIWQQFNPAETVLIVLKLSLKVGKVWKNTVKWGKTVGH